MLTKPILKIHKKRAELYQTAADIFVEKAQAVYDSLAKKYSITWDARGNIGKRYLYQDEIGTPVCITIDFDTLEDDTVTVRDRDTTEQERIKLSNLEEYLASMLQ